MANSYAKMSLADLEREKARIERAIESRQGREKDSVMKKIAALASSSGFELDELFGEAATAPGARSKKRASKKVGGRRTSAAKGKKVAPKYRNPNDPDQTWAGRGRQPRWFADAIAKGKKPEDMTA